MKGKERKAGLVFKALDLFSVESWEIFGLFFINIICLSVYRYDIALLECTVRSERIVKKKAGRKDKNCALGKEYFPQTIARFIAVKRDSSASTLATGLFGQI